jgi:hypothetical protein
MPLVGYSIRVPPLRVLKKWHDGLQDAAPDAELYTTGSVLRSTYTTHTAHISPAVFESIIMQRA